MEGIWSTKKDKYSIYYSYNPNTIGHAGTGFIIQKAAMSKVLSFEPISDRIFKLRVKGKFHNLTLVNVYALTEDKKRMLKNNFTRNCREHMIEYQNMM
jgi:hypothetical protein